MQWWREARFGMFIHWGLYAVPAGTYQGKKIGGIGEWIMYSGELKPIDSRIRSAADGSLTLLAEDSEIHGHTTTLEGKKDGPKNIGDWHNPDNWVSWSGPIEKPGKYKVELDYACPSTTAGTTFDVEVGKAKVSGTVEPTGGWDDYQQRVIGEVTIDQAGPLEIIVRPKKKAGDAIMNLRSVKLTPEK